EIETHHMYRGARVAVLSDAPAQPPHVQQHLRKALAREAPRWLSGQAEMGQQFQRLIDSDLALGALCDIFSFALPLEPEFKQRLLAEIDVEKRTRCLLEHLKTQSPPVVAPEVERAFPPSFSAN